MALRTRIGTACATVLVASLGTSGNALAQQPQPGCPAPEHEPGACSIAASAVIGYIEASAFTPRSDVQFEVFKSKGGPRIYGPVTRQTDGFGNRNAPGTLDNLKAGHYVVVKDIESGTEKTLVIDPVRFTDIDWAENTVAGIASSNAPISVGVDDGSGGFFQAMTQANAEGRWSADLNFDIEPGMNISAAVLDEDNDGTYAHVFETGCGSVGFCVLYTDMTNDVIGADHMTPNSDVKFEIFRRSGGARAKYSLLHAPITLHTDNTGGAEEEVGFDYGIDLVSGDRVTATDLASGVTKRVLIVSLSITTVDPATEVVNGTAPAGSTLTLGGAGPKPFELQAGAGNIWSFDFDDIGYDVTPNDWFSAVIFDEDSDNGQPDWVKAQRGTPEPFCVSDDNTVCGTSASEALYGDTGGSAGVATNRRGAAAARRLTVKAGGRNDTVVATASRRTRSVQINTGTGKLDKVVVRARKRARGNVRIGGRSKRLVVVLPAHAWGIEATVSGTGGADNVTTRRFGGKGGSSGGYRLAGKGGNDFLKGGDGSDLLIGGAGRDTCVADPNDTVRSCERVRRA